jgi:hypothetical protein
MKKFKKATLLMMLAAGLAAEVCAGGIFFSMNPEDAEMGSEQIDTTTNFVHGLVQRDLQGVTIADTDVSILRQYYYATTMFADRDAINNLKVFTFKWICYTFLRYVENDDL